MGDGRKFSLFSLFGKPGGKQPQPQRPIGGRGEDIAAAFLQGLGYAILTRNYRKRFGEIDIVAEEGDTLVFVEVKTRSSVAFGSPLEAVDARKQRRMARAALDYLSSRKQHSRPARFDVVAVHLPTQGQPRIEHVRNAFDLKY
jgi:putative endonuclease